MEICHFLFSTSAYHPVSTCGILMDLIIVAASNEISSIFFVFYHFRLKWFRMCRMCFFSPTHLLSTNRIIFHKVTLIMKNSFYLEVTFFLKI